MGILNIEFRVNQKNASDLSSRFCQLFPNESVLNGFFRKFTCEYAMPELLKTFLRENQIDIRSLYQALHYPSPNFQVMRDYSGLKYKEKKRIHFFSDLQADILNVRKSAVAWVDP